jgi:cytochrome c553
MIRTIMAAALILAAPTGAFAADAPPGAAACSGCHSTGRFVGSPVPRLIGVDAQQIATAVAEFRSGKRPATVMDRIAKGFTDDEIKAIAAWYAAQKD